MIKIDIKKLDGSEVEITGEIPATDFASFRPHILEEFRLEVELPGFRKGHAPDNLLVEKVGEEKIQLEMAEHALAHYYPEMLKENNIDAIGRPEITITKIAKDNPLGFKIKTAVMPVIKLGDYQKIAKKENTKPAETVEPTDKEIDEVIEEIRKSRAPKPEKNEDGTDKGIVLPELNDEFAKSLGKFESLADLRIKIKENLTHEKEHKQKDKKRLTIMEAIITETDLVPPKILIENELHKMVHEMRGQLESMGLNFADYLTHLKKTEEDMMKDWEPEATKRVKYSLILTEIAKVEKIVPSEESIKTEVDAISAQYSDADPVRVREYVLSVLSNEMVFKLLEELK